MSEMSQVVYHCPTRIGFLADCRTGFMLRTPRDDWPFFSFAGCYDGKSDDVGGLRATSIISEGFDGMLGLLEEHKSHALIKWEDATLHVVVIPLAYLDNHIQRVAKAFRGLSAEITRIEKALGDISVGSAGWDQFKKLFDQLNHCNAMYRPICDRWYFQGRYIKALEDFLEYRNTKNSRLRLDDTAATALVEHLEVLKRRHAAHDHDVQMMPKRLKQQNNMVTTP
jgi:hypothetical protein